MKAVAKSITKHEGNEYLSDVLLETAGGNEITAVCAGYKADHLLTGQMEDYRILYVDDDGPAYYYLMGLTRDEVIMPTPIEYQLVIDPYDGLWNTLKMNALNPSGKSKTIIKFEDEFIPKSSDMGIEFPLARAEDIEVVPYEVVDENHTRVVFRIKRTALERILDQHFGINEWASHFRRYQDYVLCAVGYARYRALGSGFDFLSNEADPKRCANEAFSDACAQMELGAEIYDLPEVIVPSGLVTDADGSKRLEHAYSIDSISYLIKRNEDGKATVVVTDYRLAKTEYTHKDQSDGASDGN